MDVTQALNQNLHKLYITKMGTNTRFTKNNFFENYTKLQTQTLDWTEISLTLVLFFHSNTNLLILR